jgi:hypothetical protein
MLSIGDRVWLWGGYDNEPQWLQGVDGYSGRVDGFLSSDSQTQSCALIRLDSPMTLHDVNTSLLALCLRYADAQWADEGVCDVRLCSEAPGTSNWKQDQARFPLVESHACYQREEPNNAFKGRRAKRARP